MIIKQQLCLSVLQFFIIFCLVRESYSQQVFRRQAGQDVRDFDPDRPCDFYTTQTRPDWCSFEPQ